MQLIKRATPGSYVKADATGTGDWVIGRIVMMDRRDRVTIDPADKSEQLVVIKSEVYKATKEEYETYLEKAIDCSTASDEVIESVSEEEVKIAQTIVKDKYRQRYKISVSPEGRKSLHNGDVVALMLEGKDVHQCYSTVATETKTSIHALMQKWSHLNNGQQRMLLGNYLRKHYKENGWEPPKKD